MNKSILAVAVLVMAAFAGFAVVGEEADAEGAPVVPSSITYSMGEGADSTTKMVGDAEVVTIAAPSELGFTTTKDFLYWSNGSAIFKAGQQYLVSALGTTANVTLTAVFDQNTYVTLVVDGQSYKCIVVHTAPVAEIPAVPETGTPGEAGYVPASPAVPAVPETWMIDTTSEQYKAADAAVKAIDLNKFRLNGWFAEDSSIAAYADLAAIAAETEFEQSTTLTLKTTAYFQITFVVEDVAITTLASDKLADETGAYVIPVAPSKENYSFSAWSNKDGVAVITYTVDGGYKPVASELSFTEDTTLYATFIPNNMTVTFMVGEFSSTQTVLYGEKAMEPALPEGYVAWNDADGNAFDFNQPIVENITIYALEGEPATIYNVTFEIEGQTPVKLDSENYTKSIPDTYREGYAFQGWVVKGGASQYVDPYTYPITEDVTFVAVYKEVAPPAPEEPGFFSTPAGQCVAVLVVFAIGVLGYLIYTGKIELPKFQISRVKGENKP